MVFWRNKVLSTKEIREIAEDVQVKLLDTGDPFSGDDWNLMQLVRSYLIQNPADDEEAITVEWLQLHGYKPNSCSDVLYHDAKSCDVYERAIEVANSYTPIITLFHRGDYWVALLPNREGEWPKKLRVRRDIRLLELALSPFTDYVHGG